MLRSLTLINLNTQKAGSYRPNSAHLAHIWTATEDAIMNSTLPVQVRIYI